MGSWTVRRLRFFTSGECDMIDGGGNSGVGSENVPVLAIILRWYGAHLGHGVAG